MDVTASAQVLRGGHSRLLRAWLAVIAVLAAGALAVALWMTFSGSEGASSDAGEKGAVGQTYEDGRFGQPIQVGDFVCHQCR